MYEIMIYLKSSNSSHLFKHPRADWDPVLNIDHHMRIIQIPRQCRSLHDETVASGFHISQAEQCFFLRPPASLWIVWSQFNFNSTTILFFDKHINIFLLKNNTLTIGLTLFYCLAYVNPDNKYTLGPTWLSTSYDLYIQLHIFLKY